MIQTPPPSSDPSDSFSRRNSHQGVGCCEHGGSFGLSRTPSGLRRSLLAWRHPGCLCCNQRRGGFHPGVELKHVAVAAHPVDGPEPTGV